jgi:hypothetical protein
MSSRQPTEEEVRDYLKRAESTLKIIQEGGLLTSDSDRSVLARRVILLAEWGLAQRDVVAAQREVLDFIEREACSLIIGGVDVDASAIRIRDKALAAVVSGTPEVNV